MPGRMRKAIKPFIYYYLALGLFSLLFSLLKIGSYVYYYAGIKMELDPILIPTIIGGIIVLKYTVSSYSFKVFIIGYISLWILRIVLMYVAEQIGETTLFGRTYRFDLIIGSYYKTVSRLDTHLPFVLYWFITYLFTMVIAPDVKKDNENKEEN